MSVPQSGTAQEAGPRAPRCREVLDEALVWAAKAGRLEVMELLVERGARVDADPYRGTPLLWAAATGRLEAARWLLDHGADVNQRATFGGPQHGAGVTALHLAAQDSRRLPLVEFLVARGADPTVEDAIYHGTPASWATHFGAREVATYLNGLTSARGEGRNGRGAQLRGEGRFAKPYVVK